MRSVPGRFGTAPLRYQIGSATSLQLQVDAITSKAESSYTDIIVQRASAGQVTVEHALKRTPTSFVLTRKSNFGDWCVTGATSSSVTFAVSSSAEFRFRLT